MKIDKISIKNFRSIQDAEITFDPSCKVLVGINESGKSNVLKALALLSDNFNPVKVNDLREILPDEDPITESYVKFVFKFEKEETDKFFENIKAEILTSDNNPVTIINGTKKIKLKELCQTRNEGIYTIDILNEKKQFRNWSFPDQYRLLDGWKKPKESLPDDFTIELNGQPEKVKNYKLIRKEDFKDTPTEHFEDANIEDLSALIGSKTTSITEEYLPDTLFWEYDEKNLLPNNLNIELFINDPNICTSLKNMFALAGITNIPESVRNARTGTINQFQNYLDRIARQTTNHFRSVWKEYKNIEFSLRLNADQIVPGIKEINSYDFARRSDGFKRFVTFLLLISVKVNTDDFQNTLLLIDEPDISLHPSGVRYLRDELIRISRKNYVVYSTHSIFMIDAADIGRHYLVKKKNEITTIESAEESNIADEEVIYNALGYSLFEILKKKNIVFEGWKDKRIFQIGLEKMKSSIKNRFKDIGMCHAKGVKSIKAITPLMELAGRKVLILSDSDNPAKEQRKIYQKDKGYGDWKIYQDIDNSLDAVTGEDFVKNDFIIKQVQSSIIALGLPSFNTKDLTQTKDKLSLIKNWLITNGLTQDQVDDVIEKIKDSIFENLKPQHIEDSYMKFIEQVSKLI